MAQRPTFQTPFGRIPYGPIDEQADLTDAERAAVAAAVEHYSKDWGRQLTRAMMEGGPRPSSRANRSRAR